MMPTSVSIHKIFICVNIALKWANAHPAGQDNDYIEWLAHSSNNSDPADGCILGYKERFLRLRKDSVCWNGRDYTVTKEPTTCSCTLTDFQWYEHIQTYQIHSKYNVSHLYHSWLTFSLWFQSLLFFSCSDFGFYHAENSSVCVEQPDLIGHSLEFCLHGRKEQLQTSG